MPQTKKVVQMKYAYDRGIRRRCRETANAPSGTKEAEGYLYDGLSQVTNRKRGTLERDTLGAITGMAFPPEREELFSFDTLGNWQHYTVKEADANASPPAQSTLFDHTRTHNVANQLTTFSNSAQPVLHDAAGNPTRQSPAPSGNWNQLTEYVWDAWNRLISVKVAGTEIARHAYDGLFRRTWLQEGGTSAPKRHFYYNQWRCIEERLGTGEPERHHVLHPHNRWHLLLRDRDTNSHGTLNERLYSLHDAMDPVAICDAGGTVQERFSYSAFGQRRVMDASFGDKTNGTEKVWNWEFHGEFSDGASGLHNYGYRYFTPLLGRWLGRDPIGERGGTNLHVALLNNFVNSFDYLGLIKVISLPEVVLDAEKKPREDRFEDVTRKNAGRFAKSCAYSTDTIIAPDSVSDFNKRLKALSECECIEELNIVGHASPGGHRVGSTHFADIDESRISAANVQAAFQGIKFCKECIIILRGCNAAEGESGVAFVRAIRKATRCQVIGFTGKTIPDNLLMDGGLPAPDNWEPDVFPHPNSSLNPGGVRSPVRVGQWLSDVQPGSIPGSIDTRTW